MSNSKNSKGKPKGKNSIKPIQLSLKPKGKPRGKPFPKGPGNPYGRQYRYPPGFAGNPGGRPKSHVAAEACRRTIRMSLPGDKDGRTVAQAIADSWGWRAILHGDVKAGEALFNRAEGMPTQQITFGDKDPLAELIADMDIMAGKKKDKKQGKE